MYQRHLTRKGAGHRRKRLPRALMSAHIVQKVQSEEQEIAQSTVQVASNKKRSAKPQTTKHLAAVRNATNIYVKPILVSVVRFAQKITYTYITHSKKKVTTRVNLTRNMTDVTISEHDKRLFSWKCFSEDLKRKIESHLTNQKDEFLRYFPDVEPQNSPTSKIFHTSCKKKQLKCNSTVWLRKVVYESLESFWPIKFTYIGSICINVPLRNGILSTYGISYAASQQVNMN
ncbi:hypothetical protein T06_9430 [Trichinella sp. T6]|nr:hypothetical protein T06_9430 [Trichinella sp. T6]